MQVRTLPGLLSVLVMKNYRGNVKLVNTLKRKKRDLKITMMVCCLFLKGNLQDFADTPVNLCILILNRLFAVFTLICLRTKDWREKKKERKDFISAFCSVDIWANI